MTADDAGRFVILDAPPGAQRLLVRPGGSWYGSDGYFLLERVEIEVPAGGTVERSVTARPAGRLRIAARSASGSIVGAPCRLVDARGNELEVSFLVRSPHSLSWTQDRLGEDAPSSVEPPLAPGRYRIECDADEDESTPPVLRDVRIEAGVTTEVEIALR